MSRDFRHAPNDIQEAIAGIQAATLGKSFEEFESDWLLRHGVQRGIEIISEASRALPNHVRALRSDIPWEKVRAIGNVLRHEYHGLSDRLIWGVVVDELPRLRMAVTAIRADLE